MTEPAPTTADASREQIATYTVKNFVDAAQLKRDLAFSSTNLTDAMMQQASMFSHYGVLSADAGRQYDVVKMLLENTEAAVYKLARDDMATKGEKPTEALLEKTISRHPRVIGMKKALNEARRVETVCKIAVEAWRHRRDMLVQHGMIAREEMKGELAISSRNVREQMLDDQKANFLERQAQKNKQE